MSSERWDRGGHADSAACYIHPTGFSSGGSSPARLETHSLSGAPRSITETARVAAARGTGVTACGGAKPADPGEETGCCRLRARLLPALARSSCFPGGRCLLRELQPRLPSV